MSKIDLFQVAYHKFNFVDITKAEQLLYDLIDIADVMGYKQVSVVQAQHVWEWFSHVVFDEIWHEPIQDKYIETLEMAIVYFIRQFGLGNTTEQTRTMEPHEFN